MEVNSLFVFVVFNILLLFICVNSKPFSINKALAEGRNINSELNRGTLKNLKKKSPLIYKKAFEIKTQLNPEKQLDTYKKYPKRISKTPKRGVNRNDESFNKKYLPLLKSISLLVDNILGDSDTGYSREFETDDFLKYKNRNECSCAHRSNSDDTKQIVYTEPKAEYSEQISYKETTSIVTPEPTFTEDTTEIKVTPKANLITNYNRKNIGQHKILPLLSSRNSLGLRRNYNGHSKRSGSSFHRGSERYIPRNNGVSQRFTGVKTYGADARDDKENTNSHPRNYPGRGELFRRLRGDRDRDEKSETTDQKSETIESKELLESEVTTPRIRGKFITHQRKDIKQMGGDETENTNDVSTFNGGREVRISEQEISDAGEPLQSESVIKESIINDTVIIPSDQRFFDGNGSITSENKEIRSKNETMMTLKDLINPSIEKDCSGKSTVVIIDGYSIARDVNGENKLSKQAIRLLK